MLAIDTETTGFEWWGKDWPFLITASDHENDYAWEVSKEGDITQLGDAPDFVELVEKQDALVFHNATFDLHMLIDSLGLDEGLFLSKTIHDTDILARIVMGEGNRTGSHKGGFGLKTLATALLDDQAGRAEEEIYAAARNMGLLRGNMKNMPDGAYLDIYDAYPEVMLEYAMKDTRYTYDLYWVLGDKATEDHIRIYKEIEQPLIQNIYRMQSLGFQVDRERVGDLYRSTLAELDEVQDAIADLNDGRALTGERDEIVSFFERNGVVLTERTDSGLPRIDKWALAKLPESEAIEAFTRRQHLEKLLHTYIEPMVDRDTVHPNFIQVGAWTGRMSCRSPNMQNVPSRAGTAMRSMFTPRDSFALAVYDYSSIELRILAYYANAPHLWEWIETGDPFAQIGAMIYGTEDQEKWRVPRGALKNGTYAITYGAGGPKIAQTIGGGMTVDEGRALKSSIEATLDGPDKKYSALKRRIRNKIKAEGTIRTMGGRVSRLDPDKSYVGLNALIQGSAADVMKHSINRVVREVPGVRPILVVHDELVCEVPIEHADTLGDMIRYQMEEAGNDLSGGKLNLKVDGKVVEGSYADAK